MYLAKLVQKSFRQKIPRDLRFLLSVVKAGRCAFLSTDFSTILLRYSFSAIFHSICFCALIHALFRDKWQRKGRRLGKSEMDKAYRHSEPLAKHVMVRNLSSEMLKRVQHDKKNAQVITKNCKKLGLI